MTSPAARRRSQFIDAVIDDYAAAHSTPPDADQLELQRITQEKTGQAAGMQIGDDQAVLMEMLVRAMGAKRAVEIGTFTGYSALAVARGLGPGGRLLCCDVSREWTSIARAAWEEAGVADRIELRIGPGLETLRALPPGEQFDFVFIDADKTGYARYYEEVLTRLRPGGLMLLDNTLQGGHVAGDLAGDEDVAAIRSLNDAIAADPRVKVVLIPIGDGVSVVQKLGERQRDLGHHPPADAGQPPAVELGFPQDVEPQGVSSANDFFWSSASTSRDAPPVPGQDLASIQRLEAEAFGQLPAAAEPGS